MPHLSVASSSRFFTSQCTEGVEVELKLEFLFSEDVSENRGLVYSRVCCTPHKERQPHTALSATRTSFRGGKAKQQQHRDEKIILRMDVPVSPYTAAVEKRNKN